ncbi:hypothetical protein B1A_11123, partial [mine drainage metagenome]
VSTVILGASRIAQLEENLGALAVTQRLDQSAWKQVEQTFATS